jgi:hypothetical protein
MLAHRITLVFGKAIARMLFIEPPHNRVARGLGEDGTRGNGQALAISLHDRLLGYGQIPDAACVDEQMLDRQREPLNPRRIASTPAQ